MIQRAQKIKRLIMDVTGVVQGVGFRPAVYRLALEAGFVGMVQNLGGKVRIIIEGETSSLQYFANTLPLSIKRYAIQSEVVSLDCSWANAEGLESFIIEQSADESTMQVAIPTDLVSCPDCLNEFFDPSSRRYLYPFTTCTACGPRYTVVQSMPYDRCRTTLDVFPLCDACQVEYIDPLNRRFHAESTACPVCGPSLALYDSQWQSIAGESGELMSRVHDALEQGAVVAVRGLGGYLLCADAQNPAAIGKLRQLKQRPHKPFALMARDLDLIEAQCELDEAERQALQTATGPIVILQARPNTTLPLAAISPDSPRIGMMLPTTPLHLLLLGTPEARFNFLISTSGNRAGEPICRDDEEARSRLKGIADLYLTHNREIARVCDDSLFAQNAGRVRVMRRARGMAPTPLRLSQPLGRTVLGMGADLKNCLCLGYGDQAVLSPHIGDLDYFETNQAQQRLARLLPEFLAQPPQAIAVDMHPDYQSSHNGAQLAKALNLPLIEVQHHHAHAAAVMAEYQLEQALAIVFDGIGYGSDDTLWGGEFLKVDTDGFERLGHLNYAPLLGGDRAVREPRRQLISRLIALDVNEHAPIWQQLGVLADERAKTRGLLEGNQAIMTSSCGRLFDAVAALLGIADDAISYEGQAALRLETLAWQSAPLSSSIEAYDLTCLSNGDLLQLPSNALLLALLAERQRGIPPALLAAKFHLSLAKLSCELIAQLAQQGGLPVVLCGGVMQNRLLTELLCRELTARQLTAYLPERVPCNDGAIALGQVAIAGRVCTNYR